MVSVSKDLEQGVMSSETKLDSVPFELHHGALGPGEENTTFWEVKLCLVKSKGSGHSGVHQADDFLNGRLSRMSYLLGS